MVLGRMMQSGIERAAHDAGLVLTAEQVRDIAEAESACLAESGRVSFGESAAARVVRAFATSPFIVGEGAAEVIAMLTESFYDLREDYSAAVTDVEILEALQESFDGDATGDAGLAAALAGEALARRMDHLIYEIADDEGNVYRWDPEEWHDDVTADGWDGERWEDDDE